MEPFQAGAPGHGSRPGAHRAPADEGRWEPGPPATYGRICRLSLHPVCWLVSADALSDAHAFLRTKSRPKAIWSTENIKGHVGTQEFHRNCTKISQKSV